MSFSLQFDSPFIGNGMIIIISSPSGTGKSTISRLLHQDHKLNLSISISVTTRKKRPNEINGKHYYFASVQKFKNLCKKNKFIEYAKVHGNYYATLYKTTQKIIKKGNDMIFDIDHQGAFQIKKKLPNNVLLIFILPPSMKELKNRLTNRAEDSEKIISLRMKNAIYEAQYCKDYDYVVINDDLKKSLKIIKSIIFVERLKRNRIFNIQEFLEILKNEKY